MAKPASKRKKVIIFFPNSKGGLSKTTCATILCDLIKLRYPGIKVFCFDPTSKESVNALTMYYPDASTKIDVSDEYSIAPVIHRALEGDADVVICDSMGTQNDENVNAWMVDRDVPATIQELGGTLVLAFVNDFNHGIADSYRTAAKFATAAGIHDAHALVFTAPYKEPGVNAPKKFAELCEDGRVFFESMKEKNSFIPAANWHNLVVHRVPSEMMDNTIETGRSYIQSYKTGAFEKKYGVTINKTMNGAPVAALERDFAGFAKAVLGE